MPIGFIWQTFLETPLVNFMVLLTIASFGSYGIAILAFTVISRGLTFPLTLRTMRSTKAMQDIQPQLQEMQKKYSDPKRRSEETMKLYREAGINPLGCLGSQLIQFPIFIALYQVIRITIADTPEGMLYLEGRLYDFDLLRDAVPLSTRFFFMDLGAQRNYFLVGLVFAAMWLQQRIASSRSTAAATDQQKQMNQMMQWMLPAMFAWFVIVVPAGLGLYWAATTIIGIVLQWTFVGPGDFTWGSLIPAQLRALPGAAIRRQPTNQPAVVTDGDGIEMRSDNGPSSRDQRRRRRGGDPSSSGAAGARSRPGRRRRRPRR